MKETSTCDLCATPFKPRRESERFCCRGCEFVEGLIGQAGAAPARAIRQGRIGSWSTIVFFFGLALLNAFIASAISSPDIRVPALFFIFALLCAAMALLVLLSVVRRGRRSPR